MPETLNSAARRLCTEAGLHWPSVFGVYSRLQASGALPVSKGRRIYAATPERVATLLIGVAINVEPSIEADAVALFANATCGDGWNDESLVAMLQKLLTDAKLAALCDKVVLDPAILSATVHWKGRGKPDVFGSLDDDMRALAERRSLPLISALPTISGDLFRRLQAGIEWAAPGEEIYRAGTRDDG